MKMKKNARPASNYALLMVADDPESNGQLVRLFPQLSDKELYATFSQLLKGIDPTDPSTVSGPLGYTIHCAIMEMRKRTSGPLARWVDIHFNPDNHVPGSEGTDLPEPW